MQLSILALLMCTYLYLPIAKYLNQYLHKGSSRYPGNLIVFQTTAI